MEPTSMFLFASNAILAILILMALVVLVFSIRIENPLIPMKYVLLIEGVLSLLMAGFALLLGRVGIPLAVLEVGSAIWMIRQSRRLIK